MKVKKIVQILLFLGGCVNVVLADSQHELNKAACDQLQRSDAYLNKVYQQIKTKYHDDKVFLNQLVTAQKKWIEFRDAYVASMYIPKEDYGSAQPMCQCYFMERITSERAKQLSVWMDGITEGDVCSGSVKN